MALGMSMMTSRERVRAALNHQETDRVPVDFGGSRITGIGAIAYRNLLRHLGLDEPIYVYDNKQQLAEPSLPVINRLGADIVQLQRLGPSTGMPFLRLDRWKEATLTDGTPCLVPEDLATEVVGNGMIHIVHNGEVHARRSKESFYFDVCHAPLANASCKADIDAFQFPDAWSEREEAYLRERIQILHHGTDKALFAGLPLMNCSFFEVSLTLFGFENFMLLLMDEPQLIQYWLDRMLEHDFEILERFLAIAGPYIEAIQMNDDYGTQDALMIDPTTYRTIFKPAQKRWVEFVKQRTNAKVFIHCDGAIEEILPDFIEVGIDILNPLQTSAKGMDPAKIKAKYGRDLAFWGGGVETQSTLPFGSVEDIRREVRDRIKLLGKGGGYVFGTIHNIQPDIPPEKILAVFDTAAECGHYPLG
jgi:uroporphyrinogen decarboxylase